MCLAEMNIRALRQNAQFVVAVRGLEPFWQTRRRAQLELQSFSARQQGRIEATP